MEVHSESTDGWWIAAIAAEVLAEAVPRATKLVRAVIAGGREITVEDARRGTGEDPLHHMVQSLATTTRRLGPRYYRRRGLARPLDPIRERGNDGIPDVAGCYAGVHPGPGRGTVTVQPRQETALTSSCDRCAKAKEEPLAQQPDWRPALEELQSQVADKANSCDLGQRTQATKEALSMVVDALSNIPDRLDTGCIDAHRGRDCARGARHSRPTGAEPQSRLHSRS